MRIANGIEASFGYQFAGVAFEQLHLIVRAVNRMGTARLAYLLSIL